MDVSNALRIAVAEDEPMNQKRLVRLLEDCGCEVVACFENGLALEDWVRAGNEVDALFVDVQMPGLDGISLRASLNPNLPVVFVTSYAEHAVEAYNLEVLDFLLKPVTTERLAKALSRVRKALGRETPAHGSTRAKGCRFPVHAGDGTLLLDFNKITHFELEDQVVWVFAGKKFRTKWKNLGEAETFFPDAGLLRIHRHLLIRPEAVLGIRSTAAGARVMVRMTGGVELEASRGATPKLKERLGLE